MNIEIISNELALDVYGLSGVALDQDYSGMAFKLSGQMWNLVKSNGIKSKGKNIWIYDSSHSVFAGVQLEDGAKGAGLECKPIRISKYAYFKHIGPYRLIKTVGQKMTDEISKLGLATRLPYIETYGHWNADESKLETELIMSLL